MHLLLTRLPVRLTETTTLEPGEYVVEDIAGAQLLIAADGDTLTPFTDRRPFDEAQDWNGKRILVMRPGGIGDIVLLTPILRELNLRWPKSKIDVCAIAEFSQPLIGLPYVNEIIDYPITRSALETYDCWMFLENAVERGEDSKTLHSVDCYAKVIGLTGDFDKRQEYRITLREAIWAQEAYPRTPGVRRLAIQTSASGVCRTYPVDLLQKMVGELMTGKEKWEVFLMDKPGSIRLKDAPENSIRVLTDGLTFRQRCAAMATCDCLLAPDSSMTHVAGALGLPCVALYSVFPWQLRTAYAPTTKALTGNGTCAPCHFHARGGKHFPDNCPSKDRGICEVLASITPERLLAKIRLHAKGFKLEVVEDEK